jgi:Asp-tRNA(Asn)/Glu-tRNA(Gln) amidotransferase A subunit family amidase
MAPNNDAGVPDDVDRLLDAFWRYERALLGNDTAALDALFAAGNLTLRADGTGVLVGHDAISAFRRSRAQPPPSRVIERLHLRPVGPHAALLVAETVRGDGGRATQTQLWARDATDWHVTAAHVSHLAEAEIAVVDPLDRRIWRVREDEPLRDPTGSGALDGMGVAVKDLFAVQGQRIGAGNPDHLAAAATEATDAAAVAGLLAAGAHVVGIAHTDEFAFGLAGQNVHYGTPPNAVAPGRIPGGSTSGPAAAVAAGLADIGLGTDTAGSIRVPASYCGLFGLATTHGAISSSGLEPLAASFDRVGLLARRPEVLAAAAGALLPDQTGRIGRLVVADDVLALVDEPMRVAFDAGLRAFAGRTQRPVERIGSLYDGALEDWFAAFRLVQAVEGWRAHGDFVDAHAERMDPDVVARFRAGSAVADDDHTAACDVLAAAKARLQEIVPPGVALALPATGTPAPLVDAPAEAVAASRAATLRLNCAGSLSGRPALVLPTLRLAALPAGLCLLGAPGADRALVELLPPALDA